MDFIAIALFLVGLSLFAMEKASPGFRLSALGAAAIVASLVLFLTSSYPLSFITLAIIAAISAFYPQKNQPVKKEKKKNGR